MMGIMVVSTGPKRQEMVQGPGKLVAGMRIDGLEQPRHDPEIHGQDVQIACEGAPEDGAADGAEAEHQDFDRGGVFCGESKGRGVLVVDFVDVFVEEGPGVHGAVRPVVPCVFHDEEDGDLQRYGVDAGEGHRGG